MTHGIYYYLSKAWRTPDPETQRKRMVEWRASDAIVKVEKPLKLQKARMLGYKAKKGIIVVRVKLLRGGRKRPRPRKGRRSKRMSVRKTLQMNYRGVAEQRAARRYRNMEVINSYFVGKDGMYYFFEVILADRDSPDLKNDRQFSYLSKSTRGKAFRGTTSAGVRSRGLRHIK
ncbi:MAG: 50S ribosomal protein L15e [Nanoarchaeota archaeon]|nr:50S ribosomal protein L15e [Nanoarchaeota archaeon]